MTPTILLLSWLAFGTANGHWSPDFYVPFPDVLDKGASALLLTKDGTLVAGGDFTSVAGVLGTTALAQWRGADWTDIGGGLAPRGVVNALLEVGDDLYVGGKFKSIGGLAITNLARWNGTNWNDVGGGVTGNPTSGAVLALAWHDGELLVGGTIISAGGVPISGIASWNGATWSDLHSGVNGTVKAIVVHGPNVYVGGQFSSAGGTAATNIARWDGQGWFPLGTGEENGVTTVGVASLTITPDGILYVGGMYTTQLIAGWDGQHWFSLGNGLSLASGGIVSSLYFNGDLLYAAGNFMRAGNFPAFGFAAWDGSNWSPIAAPVYPVPVITGSGTNIFVAGVPPFPSVLGRDFNTRSIARFDGTNWSLVGAGINDLNGAVKALAPFQNKMFVGGLFNRQLLAAWDGQNWALPAGTNLNTPAIPPGVFALTATDDTLYAAGQFNSIGQTNAQYVAEFDGTNWFPLGSGLPSKGLALARRGAELFAGHKTGISKWNGHAWVDMGLGLAGEVRSIALDSTHVFAGGTFTNSGSTQLNHISYWDGSVWNDLGGGVNGNVNALAVYNHILYAGGDFSIAGSIPAERVARWDRTRWAALDNGFMTADASVASLAVAPDGSLYVGGLIRHSGPMTGIAKWDGTGWNYLGTTNGIVSGLSIDVYSLTFRGADLFMGGDFAPPPIILPGPRDTYSAGFAMWHVDDPLLVPAISVAESVRENTVFPCSITVSNPGPARFTNCLVTLTIPNNASFSDPPGGVVLHDQTAQWTLGDIAAGETKNVAIVLRATSGPLVALDYSVTDQAGRTYRGPAAFTTVTGRLRFFASHIEGKQLSVSISGTDAAQILIQTSSDLLHWQDLSMFAGSQSPFDIELSFSSDSQSQFFRIQTTE